MTLDDSTDMFVDMAENIYKLQSVLAERLPPTLLYVNRFLENTQKAVNIFFTENKDAIRTFLKNIQIANIQATAFVESVLSQVNDYAFPYPESLHNIAAGVLASEKITTLIDQVNTEEFAAYANLARETQEEAVRKPFLTIDRFLNILAIFLTVAFHLAPNPQIQDNTKAIQANTLALKNLVDLIEDSSEDHDSDNPFEYSELESEASESIAYIFNHYQD